MGRHVLHRRDAAGVAGCAGTSVFTSTAVIHNNGSYSSGLFTATATGDYRWVARYSGDTNNAAAPGACNDVNESVVISAAATTTTIPPTTTTIRPTTTTIPSSTTTIPGANCKPVRVEATRTTATATLRGHR